MLGQESTRTAEASECAAEQDQFWAYHDRVFANQATERSRLTDEVLIQIAADLDLDLSAFEACLKSERYAEQIKQEANTARQMSIRATPGFVINGNLAFGAQPYEAFAQAFDAELENLGWEGPAEAESDRD